MLRHCAYIVTFVPSVLRWRIAETKPGARRTETSVASVRSSMSRRWFAGSTVNTLIRVITSSVVEIVVMASLPSERVGTRPESRSRQGRRYAAAALLRRDQEERDRGYDRRGKKGWRSLRINCRRRRRKSIRRARLRY